jgi:hypothetical protein
MKTKWSIAAWLVVTTSLLLTASSPTGVSPTLVSSTYLGSSEGDGPNSWLKRFSLDDSGTVYFAQSTYHTDFPTTADAYSRTYNGGSEQWGKEDLAIVEFNTTQNALKYASYFGGATGPDFVTQVLRHKNSVYLAEQRLRQDVQRSGLPPCGWLHRPLRRQQARLPDVSRHQWRGLDSEHLRQRQWRDDRRRRLQGME